MKPLIYRRTYHNKLIKHINIAIILEEKKMVIYVGVYPKDTLGATSIATNYDYLEDLETEVYNEVVTPGSIPVTAVMDIMQYLGACGDLEREALLIFEKEMLL